MTGFYGEPETTRSIDAWNKHRYLNSHSDCPWLCFGDFSEIVKQDVEDGSSIWERLDRGLGTNNWFLRFLGLRAYHLHCDSSDHQPIHIVFSGLDPPLRKKPFRFEEMWLSNPSCEDIVQSAWYSIGRSD